MNKGNQTTAGARAWRFINQPGPLRLQAGKRRSNVGHPNSNVMNPRPAFLQEFSYRRSFAERLEQFDVRLSHGQHSNANSLFRHFFSEGHLQPKRVSPKRERLVELVGGNANVIDVHNTSRQ